MAIDVRGMTPLIEVFDMPTSLKFYRDVLGFEMAGQSSPGDNCDWCALRLQDFYLMLNTAYEQDERPPSPDPSRVRAHRDIGLFFRCPDPDAAYDYLREKGVDLKPPKDAPYGMRQLYLNDPDGYVLCFQWPVADK
jgi:catechol 2,3-dioxygenase-like lactoylglutathione lyase family enzyme